ncbi:MAG: hypothetical protein QNK04_11060 [Myxococcota bacterium]|nr:hypothetical protein [Myxococcota bacterium]
MTRWLAVVAAALWAAPALAEPPPEKDWSFVLAPYIWLPAMTGEATVRGIPVEVETDISDIFDKDRALSVKAQFEAWYKRRFGLLFDGQWSWLKQKDNLDGTILEFDFTMHMGYFDLYALYDFGERPFTSEPGSPTWSIQPMVGARLSVMKLEVDFDRFGSPDSTKVWADPLLGLRTELRFGNDNRWRWRMRYDFGGFGAGSDFTWQAIGALGYDFTLWRAAATVALGAQALSQDFEDGGFRWDVTQYGPLLTLGFRF